MAELENVDEQWVIREYGLAQELEREIVDKQSGSD